MIANIPSSNLVFANSFRGITGIADLAKEAESIFSLKESANEQNDHSNNENRTIHYLKDYTWQAAKNLSPATTKRKAWSFLTMGIPVLIESFSIFLDGIIHREKNGLPLQIRFKTANTPQKYFNQLVKFQKINNCISSALSEFERAKAVQIIQRIKSNDTDSLSLNEKLKPYLSLLEKCNRLHATRSQFVVEDWKTIDSIDFELLQDFLINLCDVYNSTWMKDSGLRDVILDDFRIDYYEAVIAENLSLSLAYVEGLDGNEISIPVFDAKTSSYHPVVYTIRATRLGDAMPCYVLESEDLRAHPWFVVRGTQSYTGLGSDGKELRQGSLESILADSLDHECITRNVINKALVSRPIVKENGKFVQKESLSDIFRNWKQRGQLVKLCGHSLGGALVNALTVEFYDQVKSAYSFSGAGISKETAKKWDSLTLKDKEKSYDNKLFNFDYEGDFIPSGGRCLIGNHYAMSCIETNHKRSLYESHVSSHLNRDFQIQKVDVNAENNKFSRRFMEVIRVVVGRCFRFLLQFFSENYIPDWWARQKIYKKHADFERSIRYPMPLRNPT